MTILLSPTNLIQAIEANQFSLIPAFGRLIGAEIYEGAEIRWSLTDVRFSYFNSVMCARLLPDRIDEVIRQVIQRAAVRDVPVLWWIGPQTQPADLGRHLERYGFSHEEDMPGMAADLEQGDQQLPTPPGFRLQRVEDLETLQAWSQVTSAGFEMPEFTAVAYYDMVRLAGMDNCIPYLGRLHGEPVGTSLLFPAAGVAGIYNVAVIPSARRRGIGALLTLAALQKARFKGYRYAILQAAEMGVGIYRRLGFREYCKISIYVWEPS